MIKHPIRRGLVLGLAIAAMPLNVLAIESPTPMPSSSPATIAATPAPRAAASTANEQRLTNLKARGAAEIDRRLASLDAALVKLEASTRLSPADKAALISQVSDERAGLTSLKTKLAADTTLAAARADVAIIVTDYRVYALMLPKVRLVSAADRMIIAQSNLAELQIKLQTRVSAAGSNGKSVTDLQTKLDGMKAKLADASAQTNNVVPKVLALQPSDYNASRTVLLTYRQNLASAQTSLKGARDDAKAIIAGLQSL